MWKKLSIAAGIVLLLLIGIRSSFAGERQSRYMVGIAPNDIRYFVDRALGVVCYHYGVEEIDCMRLGNG